ncbi:carbohydrate ABC transporter permease [Jiangella asiatica]|uniref:Carbohydrate ABC transporter permease n=1 Tax=Jiangella asiatica TaxID=2530372 RepID=A0A4R5DCJ1_9ACTN|nr:carbohydrate ABC transporter permease [Jiangella asiatica]TDE08255.1 carbohydrate ABC transporter permease [Jiangella asiatica]
MTASLRASIEAPPVTGRRRSRRTWLVTVLLCLASVAMLYPLLWMLASSFKPADQIFGTASFWPQQWIIDHYADGWNSFGFTFGRYFVNSFIVAAGAIVGNLLSCSLAAYAFARIDFKFKKFWLAVMLMTIMLPYHVVVLPQYIMFQEFGWLNTFFPLVVPKFLATDAFFVFLMVQFIRGLPRSLDEAARIDGCNRLQIFLRIILPLIRPALATTAIFTFIWTWNDFFTPLIYLTDPAMYTVPLGLNAFLDSTGESAWGSLFAMAVLSLGPVLGFFIVAQKYLVRGIATTGLK